MGEERRGRWPGQRDQEDLLDQSCVCVTQLQREAGFVSCRALSVLGSSVGESRFSFASASAILASVNVLAFEGFLGGKKNKNNVLYSF